MKNVAIIIFGALLVLTINSAINEQSEHELQRQEYCDMVALYKQTNGQNGWPDYRGNAAEVCK